VKFFAQRLIEPELLDHAPPAEARRNLADLVSINERLGGHSTIRKTLRQVAQPGDHFTLLDVGAASGDSGRVIAQLYPAAIITSLDYNAVNIEMADQPKLLADAFALPFRPASFDFVLTSLFLHHFTDAEVTSLLASFYGIARRALLVCDLERRLTPFVFLPLARPFFGWNKITLNDGMISIRAAFRVEELRKLSEAAGIPNAEVAVHRPAFRISLVARK
jgi:2-polyprenyl-3-methyl-5-hydroxy-6-metoxy-1,4-benzoquinol methylase